MKKVYLLDNDKDEIFFKSLKKAMKKEQNVEIVNVNLNDLKEKFKTIPDICIINEEGTNTDIKEVFQAIKEAKQNSNIPLIVLSSSDDEEHIIEILKNDVEICLKYPLSCEILYYTIMNLIKLLNRNRTVSPLTGLPGNAQIQSEMQERLDRGEKYAMMYLDLDNFKAYNDTYGFSNGDEIIKLTANIITKNVLEDNKKNFVGHIGGDDFVALVEDSDYEKICQNIIAEFDRSIVKYFTKEDIERGYLEVENRKGIIEPFPLTTISIGVVEVTKERFKNTLEIGEAGAAVKHLAKTIWGSTYVIDRRKNREEIFDKAAKKKIQ